MQHLLRHGAVLSCVALVAALLVSADIASAADPGPSLVAGAPAYRRAPFSVTARGLEPGGSYTLTTDGGQFEASGTATLVASADAGGELWTQVVGTGAVSPSVSSVDVALAASDDPSTTIATAIETFAAPYASGSVCPGVSDPIAVSGLADGDYRLSRPSATFAGSTAHAGPSPLLTSMTSAPDAAAVSTVTVTSVQDPSISYALPVRRGAPRLTVPAQAQYSPWQLRYTADCFAPGESVVQVSSAAGARCTSAWIGAATWWSPARARSCGSSTRQAAAASVCGMLPTGEVVLRTARHRTVWSTHTRSSGAVVEVGANGDVGIFSARGHHQLWHTGTAI